MPPRQREHNRGPAAAAGNRQAVLEAAKRLFAERGYHVPLSSIAKEAGVGQGVLYRHFPTRLSLAFAVFEENFAELEQIGAQGDAEAFGRLWQRLVELTLESAAFVEMAVDARRSTTEYDGGERLVALLAPPLARAREAGAVDADLEVGDVLTAQRMVYGIVATALDLGEARETLRQVMPQIAPWSATTARS